MALDQRDLNETSRAPWAIPVVLTLVAMTLGVWRVFVGYRPAPAVPPPDEAASAAEASRAPPAPRCVELSDAPFVIGDAPPPRATPPEGSASSGGPSADPSDEIEDPTAPFAVEIGR